MKIKGLIDEDFIQYKKPSMFIVTSCCDWKCCKEGGFDKSVCQNSPLVASPTLEAEDKSLTERYLLNPITSAIVIGGLEPFDQEKELFNLIEEFRQKTDDDIVIYTGFYPEEIEFQVRTLAARHKNIIIKFGRYVPNKPKRYDEVLGVTLASDNQFAVKIS